MDLFSTFHQASALLPAEGIPQVMLMERVLALLDTGLLIAVLWVFHRSFPKLHALIAQSSGPRESSPGKGERP